MKPSETIKSIRSQLGLTQRQLADLTGVTRCTIADVETGRTRCTAELYLSAQALISTSGSGDHDCQCGHACDQGCPAN